VEQELNKRVQGRVLFVIPRWESFLCFFRELAAALREEGWEVHCAACIGGDRIRGDREWVSEDRDGVWFHRVDIPRGINGFYHLRAARVLRRVVAELEPDWVHAHFSAAIFCAAIARTEKWPPVYGTFHGLGYPIRKGVMGLLVRLAECGAAARMDRILVLTEDDRNRLWRDLRGRSVEVLASAGVGCDLDRFDADAVDGERVNAWRKIWGLTGRECVFGFVGRWTDFKGFGCLVRAFFEVSKECVDARLLLVGEPDDMHADGLDQEERRRLLDHPRVIRAGQRDDPEQMLALMDALVFPSWREGVPVSVMEALSMGVPVLAWNVRGCRDVVRNGVDGELLAPDGSGPPWERLAERMRVWCRQPELRHRYAEGAVAGRMRLGRARYVRAQLNFYGRERACTGV
jgi:glycosyltransferase involved in cell wall biosynthesis